MRWPVGGWVGLACWVISGCAADGLGGGAGGWPGYETEEVARWLTVGQLLAMEAGEPMTEAQAERARPVMRVLDPGSGVGNGVRYLVWVLEPEGVIYAERQRPSPVVWHGPIRPTMVPKPGRVLVAEARAEAESRARLRRMRER